MSTYYRLRLGDEPVPPSSIYVRGGWVIPMEEAKPEPPAHRVEDETWADRGNYIDTDDRKYGVCEMPNRFTSQSVDSLNRWEKRKRRICAGQEALKLIESGRLSWYGTMVLERDRILALLK